jgi:hypothetical protein
MLFRPFVARRKRYPMIVGLPCRNKSLPTLS